MQQGPRTTQKIPHLLLQQLGQNKSADGQEQTTMYWPTDRE